jgi:hypothetical protein
MPRITNRPNYAARWTPEEFEQMAAALRAGRTIAEIAKAMGRSAQRLGRLACCRRVRGRNSIPAPIAEASAKTACADFRLNPDTSPL